MTPSLRALFLTAPFVCASLAHATDAKPGCTYIELAKLPLTHGGPSLQPMVQGSINGAPAPMLLDTGATATALTRTGTEKHDLTLSATGAYMRGIGGESALYATRVKEFKIGPSRGTRMNLPVIGEMGAPPSFHAIVGADFLLQTDMEISLAEKYIKFFRPKECGDAFLGYWDAEANVLPYEARRGGHREGGANPVLKVLVNGKEVRAIIRSGASRSILKMNAAKRIGINVDAPQVERAGNSLGIGGHRVRTWTAVMESISFGRETIRNAPIDIIDEAPGAVADTEMLLGADFLRTHRVLFAAEQKKVYITYLGGEVFSKRSAALDPWIIQEAESGNPDAQHHLWSAYTLGRRVPKDAAKAREWLDKAVAQNHLPAQLAQAGILRRSGKAAEAVERLRGARAANSGDTLVALELFLAQTYAGEKDAARSDLGAVTDARWPAPIADYYLGRIDAAALLKKARKDDDLARERACQAGYYIAQLHYAMGDPLAGQAATDSVRKDCNRTPD